MKYFTKDYPGKKDTQKSIRELVAIGNIDEKTALTILQIVNDAAASAYEIGYSDGVIAATPGPGPEVPKFMTRPRKNDSERNQCCVPC